MVCDMTNVWPVAIDCNRKRKLGRGLRGFFNRGNEDKKGGTNLNQELAVLGPFLQFQDRFGQRASLLRLSNLGRLRFSLFWSHEIKSNDYTEDRHAERVARNYRKRLFV
jgi:hypothetical protein